MLLRPSSGMNALWIMAYLGSLPLLFLMFLSFLLNISLKSCLELRSPEIYGVVIVGSNNSVQMSSADHTFYFLPE